MLHVLDWALFVFHGAFILFNMVGWIWDRTRVFHLATLGFTAFSWFVMGAYWGWGYCVCTDLHSTIRERLGYANPEATFIQQLGGHFFGISIDRTLADWIAGIIFTVIVCGTFVVWFRQLRTRAI